MREAAVRLHIERLAPTGEGVAHLSGKVVFVDGVLPDEEVEAVLFEEKARYARATMTDIFVRSPGRRETDPHSAACGGTDWPHITLEAARAAKRALFRETMAHIRGIDLDRVGDLPISSSVLEYRLRNQFHAERDADGVRVGFFARRSHRVVPLDGCEIVSAATRAKISAMAASSLLRPAGRFDSLETVETDAAHRLAVCDEGGAAIGDSASALDIRVGRRSFRVSTPSFFQVNRHRIEAFFGDIHDLAAASGATTAVDAYAGVGFLSQALVEAGASVIAIESSPSSAADAGVNRERFAAEDVVDVRNERLETFLGTRPEQVDLVVADPPRGGLRALARPLAALARGCFLYISCEPSSLARDLGALLDSGLAISSVRLEDFFPLTHRIEAIVALARR